MEWELLETFTGTRAQPDLDNPGEEIQVPCKDILVRFVHNDVTHERHVNVCFDSEGQYDHAATFVRCEEMANGVRNKIELGVIIPPQPLDPSKPEE